MFNINLNVLFMIFIAKYVFSEEINPNKLCTEVSNRDACGNIQREQSYTCADNIISKTDCILNIDQGKPQFTILEPEQALLAANFVSDNVVVVGEITEAHPQFQTAVIVRKFYNNSFENLRGKRYCHPGFVHDEMVTRYVLGEFESRILKLNHTYCEINDNVSILERQIRTLSNFFVSSCRPGPWTDDNDVLDKSLKNKYSNLCDLCGAEKCAVKYNIPFSDALTCLVNGGDVAVTSIDDASAFFSNTNNKDNYQYLCPNGTASNASNNCTWTNQLKRLIVTEKNVPDRVKVYLETNIPLHLKSFEMRRFAGPLEESLENLLELSKTDSIAFIDPTPLKTYVSARRTIPTINNNTYCQETVKWCTQHEQEQQKCLWLQQAALNTGLQPIIQCVQTSSNNDTLSCLSDIQNGDADIAFADVTYGYIALKKNLTSVAYSDTVNEDLANIIIAVRNDSTDIKSLNDLQGKNACFPQYGGREWLAFIDTLKSKQIVNKSCDYSKLFSDFLGPSCVPGAKGKDYSFDTGDSEKLCDQCIPIINTVTHKYCNADQINKYYGTDGALRCLEDKAGDYAVITLKDVEEFKNLSNYFKILYQDGSLAQNTGFTLDPNAALTIITSGELVVKNNTKKRENIIQLLKGIEIEFARKIRKTFKVFEKFNDTTDLLFPDSTPGLSFDDDELGKYVDNFKTLLRNSEKCLINPNTASNLIPSTVLMIVLMLIVRF